MIVCPAVLVVVVVVVFVVVAGNIRTVVVDLVVVVGDGVVGTYVRLRSEIAPDIIYIFI